MYNSIFTYAMKSIRGKILFSIFFILALSQTFTLFSVYNVVLKLNINKNDLASFFRSMSLYYALAVAALIIVLLSLFIILYMFSQNRRIFATLRIFGASKLSLMKLSLLEVFIYNFISFFIMVIEMTIFYIRYNYYISQLLDKKTILSYILLILVSNIILSLIMFLVSAITSYIFLLKEPYENMRGTL